MQFSCWIQKDILLLGTLVQRALKDIPGRRSSLNTFLFSIPKKTGFYTQKDRDRNYPVAILESVKREGKFEEEGWRVRKDGVKFWANVSISAVYDDKKELIGFSKVTRDLTE